MKIGIQILLIICNSHIAVTCILSNKLDFIRNPLDKQTVEYFVIEVEFSFR